MTQEHALARYAREASDALNRMLKAQRELLEAFNKLRAAHQAGRVTRRHEAAVDDALKQQDEAVREHEAALDRLDRAIKDA